MKQALDTDTEKVPRGLIPGVNQGEVFRFRLGLGPRRVLKRRRKVRPSVWAEQHRVVTMSSLPGPWRNHVTPYLVGVMDAIWHPAVETVILCKAPQTGGTEAVYNAIGYSADCDPGPVLVVMPDEITARDNSRDRIQPMFSSSPRLGRYLTGSRDDVSSLRINLVHMPIYMAWARSAARLANKPIRMVVFDEVDKYPDFANAREADPIALGVKRTITYRRTRKIVKISTPTIEAGPIWHALTNEAQVIFDWMVVCPDCRREQLMEFERIRWPDGMRDASAVEQGRLAWYECRYCGAKWNDQRRDIAVRAGCWRARVASDDGGAGKSSGVEHGLELSEYLDQKRPSKIAFHIPSWISHFVSLSDAASAFLRGLRDKGKLRDFQNAHAALPWVHYEQARKEDTILALREDRPQGLIPGGGQVSALTCGVDTQDNGFWYAVVAWGMVEASDAGLTLPAWVVRAGFVLDFGDLWQIIGEDRYIDADGNEHIVTRTLQDSGGHRTQQVYDFCRRHYGKVFPAFGSAHTMSMAFSVTNIDHYPGGKKMPGGVIAYRINTKHFKDELHNRLSVAPGDPGALLFYADFPDEYARHLTAETINSKGQWECQGSRPNHLWDCLVLNLAAAETLGLKQARRRRQEHVKEPAAVENPRPRIDHLVKQRAAAMRRRPSSWVSGWQ